MDERNLLKLNYEERVHVQRATTLIQEENLRFSIKSFLK
jgi:hypothetical protein